jgi:similar to stage IV sporulation protein
MMVGVMFVFLLSNIIFSVKVIHTDKDIQSLILGELNDYGIKVHNFKKSPKRVEQIKNKILKKYKDKIEWLEIENYGTSYIVRVEERIIPDNPEVIPPRDVVAKKSAVILKITSTSGSVQKLVGNYVKAGDVIVSGTIKLNEEVKNTVPAKATVYGEVWYNVTTEYPYIYSEKQYTGNVKKGLLYNFLDNHILMFGKSYKDSKITDKFKISSTFLPIFLSFSQMREVVNIEKIYTEEEALQMAIQRSHKEIEGKLKKNEYIINETPLKVEYKDNTIVVNMFYNVCEDITEYRNIDTPPQ